MAVDRSGPGVRLTLLPASDFTQDGGIPLDLGDRLLSFEFEDAAGKRQSKATFELDNHDLLFFDEDRLGLLGGGVLMVSWGYQGRMGLPRVVTIKKVRGFTRLKIEGVDAGGALDMVERVRVWGNKTRSDVVREVAEEYGIAGDALNIEDTPIVYEVISQTGETDSRFLRRLARLEGFEFWVDVDGMHWHEQRLGEPPLHRFVYNVGNDTEPPGSIIGEPSLDVDLVRRVGRSSSKSRDPDTKEDAGHDSTSDNTDRDTSSNATQTVAPEQTAREDIDPETGRGTVITPGGNDDTERAALKRVKAKMLSRFGKGDDNSRGVAGQRRGGYLSAVGGAKPLTIDEYGMTSAELLDRGRGLQGIRINPGTLDSRLVSSDDFRVGGGVLGSMVTDSLKETASAAVFAEPPLDPREAKRRAEARYKLAERKAVKMKFTIVGDASVKAGTVCEVGGIGKRFSGEYYIRKANHKIRGGSGYTVDLEVTGDGINKGEPGKAVPKGPAALLKDNPNYEIVDGKVRLKPFVSTLTGGGSFQRTETVEVSPEGETQFTLEEQRNQDVTSWIQQPSQTIGDADPVEAGQKAWRIQRSKGG